MDAQNTFVFKKEKYEHVTSRIGAAVYRGRNKYLRIGDKNLIEKDIQNHGLFTKYGFPVSKILSKGVYQGNHFYIESSLGRKSLAKIFIKEMKKDGCVSEPSFASFLTVSKRYAKRQLASAVPFETLKTEFEQGILIAKLKKALPQYAVAIEDQYQKVVKKIRTLPLVLSHGDFCPFNVYKKGVIDLEDLFWAPLGYDMFTNIFHMDYFPKRGDYEFHQLYSFTPAQKKRYLDELDEVYIKYGLPKVSQYKKEIEFLRLGWLIVRMHKWPKIREYCLKMFLDKCLQN
ncbi:MAG: phosphotransferase [Candidatus Paceibacterota bacterium]|jgi:hypothetical protein